MSTGFPGKVTSDRRSPGDGPSMTSSWDGRKQDSKNIQACGGSSELMGDRSIEILTIHGSLGSNVLGLMRTLIDQSLSGGPCFWFEMLCGYRDRKVGCDIETSQRSCMRFMQPEPSGFRFRVGSIINLSQMNSTFDLNR